MTKQIRVRSINRREIDEDKLALAFLLLAKILDEQSRNNDSDNDGDPRADKEAA